MFKRLIISAAVAVGMYGSLTLSAEETTTPAVKPNPNEKTVTLKGGWLTVTYPKKAKVGDVVKVKVKAEGITDGNTLGADMHYFAGPKYGGFLCWQKPIPIENGKEYTLTYKIADKPGITAAGIVFYIGAKSGWKNREKGKDTWLRYIKISK